MSYGKKLTDAEVTSRMTELCNLRKLHAADQATKASLRAEIKELKAENAQLAQRLQSVTETMMARIEELETMVFGRKPTGGTPVKDTSGAQTQKPTRTNDSYRRPLPPASAITAEEHHTTNDCHRCGHRLSDKTEATRYEEDIVLAALNPEAPHRTVTKHTIERGWCSPCGQWSSAKDLRGQVATIGPVARTLITYLVIQADQTYSQTIDLLWQLYQFKVTEGEIATILTGRREAYLPRYEQLKRDIRAGPAHMDETPYPIQSEQGAGYAHVMTGVDGTETEHDVVFRLADGRGKGYSQELLGISKDGHHSQVGITDRLGNYKHLFKAVDDSGDSTSNLHQICWAHLQRTARDLTHLQCLSKAKQRHVAHFYQQLATIYALIRTYQSEPFEQTTRTAHTAQLLRQTTELCQPHSLDPKKLQNLKAGIIEYQDSLFLCLTIDGIPADNNKAERALRKLVIKRKKSFGVKTMKGARTMEVLLSVCQSLYNRDRDNFLTNLHTLATATP